MSVNLAKGHPDPDPEPSPITREHLKGALEVLRRTDELRGAEASYNRWWTAKRRLAELADTKRPHYEGEEDDVIELLGTYRTEPEPVPPATWVDHYRHKVAVYGEVAALGIPAGPDFDPARELAEAEQQLAQALAELDA